MSTQYDSWEVSTKGALYQLREGEWRALIMDYSPRMGANRAGLPGGHVDLADTSIESAFMREIYEECGVTQVEDLTQQETFMHDRRDRIIIGYTAVLDRDFAPFAAAKEKELPAFVTQRELGEFTLAACYQDFLIRHWPRT